MDWLPLQFYQPIFVLAQDKYGQQRFITTLYPHCIQSITIPILYKWRRIHHSNCSVPQVLPLAASPWPSSSTIVATLTHGCRTKTPWPSSAANKTRRAFQANPYPPSVRRKAAMGFCQADLQQCSSTVGHSVHQSSRAGHGGLQGESLLQGTSLPVLSDPVSALLWPGGVPGGHP